MKSFYLVRMNSHYCGNQQCQLCTSLSDYLCHHHTSICTSSLPTAAVVVTHIHPSYATISSPVVLTFSRWYLHLKLHIFRMKRDGILWITYYDGLKIKVSVAVHRRPSFHQQAQNKEPTYLQFLLVTCNLVFQAVTVGVLLASCSL